MNATLEDRLRRHYDERTTNLPTRGPGLLEATTLTIQPTPIKQRPNRAARVSLLVGSIAAATILGFVLLDRGTGQQPEIGSAEPPVGVLTPAETLPDTGDLSDTPVTVAAAEPSNWYRLQPDLDVAWYQDPTVLSSSMFCWRTPVASECVLDDTAGALTLIVPTAGEQTLVISGGHTDETTLDVQLTNGAILTAPLVMDATISWGVARYRVPEGESIFSIGEASAKSSETVDVSGQTLPPEVGLSVTPMTIPAGSELSYWRWFPDLNISERETATGSTELCWRTPGRAGCIDDSFISPSVGIIPTDGAAILLARPALVLITPPPTDPLAPKYEQGPLATKITATLSGGSTVTADVKYGEDFGVGYARIALPEGQSVVSAVSS